MRQSAGDAGQIASGTSGTPAAEGGDVADTYPCGRIVANAAGDLFAADGDIPTTSATADTDGSATAYGDTSVSRVLAATDVRTATSHLGSDSNAAGYLESYPDDAPTCRS
jgi:hypothetical protein